MTIKIVLILFMHLLADFLLQGSVLRKLKTSKILYLLLHVGIYTTFFLLLSPLLLTMTFKESLIFSGINGGAHLVVDFITSWFKRLYWEKKESVYVAIISVDNIIHLSILIYTYFVLFPEAAEKIF